MEELFSFFHYFQLFLTQVRVKTIVYFQDDIQHSMINMQNFSTFSSKFIWKTEVMLLEKL